jgi:aminopeptidase N
MIERYLGTATFRRGVRTYMRRHRESNTVAADLWRALSEASGESIEGLVRPWIEQEGYPVLEVRRCKSGGRPALEFRQRRFLERPATKRKASKPVRWPIPWVGRIGDGRSKGRGRLERRLLERATHRVVLKRAPRFVYGNAEEGGFFRPCHDDAEIRQLAASLGSLSAVERMGLLDHQWALVRAGHKKLGSLLDLVSAFANETEAEVLATLQRPLAFLADSLIPEAAPACREPFRAWLLEHFEQPFAQLGWKPALREPDEIRLRRAALLALVGGIAELSDVVEESRRQCERYLADRRSLDANLADGVVGLAASTGDAILHRRFVEAASKGSTPQEQRRFLMALGAFRDPKLIDATLALTLTKTVASQDVVFLLVRLLDNQAAREKTWTFIVQRWSRLRGRLPPMLASSLIEATPALLSARHRREVAQFFREHPIPSGERTLRQALERFDWYRGFRRGAATDLARWLER